LSFSGDLYPTAGATTVMSTKGDMVDYNTARQRLAIGSANQILQVKSSLPSWETVDLADTVLTTAGDVLFENATPELARLPKGTQYNNLQMGSALPAWSASSTSVLTGTGDVLYSSGANALARLSIGSTDDVLTVAGGVPTWSASGGGAVNAEILVMDNSTTIGDYSTPSSATCSSEYVSATGSSTELIDATGAQFYFYSGDQSPTTAGSATRYGTYFTSSSALIGKEVTEFSAWLSKYGSPTGTLYFRIYNSGGTLIDTFGSLDVSTLTTSFVEKTSGTGATRIIANGDRFVVDYDYGNENNYLYIEGENSCVYDCTNTYRTYYDVHSVGKSGWYTDTDKDCHMSFTYNWETIPRPCSQAVDDDVATSWQSASETNPNIYVDMSSSTLSSNLALYANTGTTETEITIQSSDNASDWATQRTITWSNLTEGAWNYIRFNNLSARYWRIYGNSGGSETLQIDEIKVLKSISDDDVRNLHGHLSISSSDTSLNNAGE